MTMLRYTLSTADGTGKAGCSTGTAHGSHRSVHGTKLRCSRTRRMKDRPSKARTDAGDGIRKSRCPLATHHHHNKGIKHRLDGWL
jgi:hypothetical protein